MRLFFFVIIMLVLVNIAPFSPSQAQTDSTVITSDNLTQLKPVKTLTPGFIQHIARVPETNILAVAYVLKIEFYDLDQTKPFAEPLTALPSQQGAIQRIALHPDGQMLAVAYSNGVIEMWNWATGELVSTIIGYPVPIQALAFSHNGQLLATSSGTLADSDIQTTLRSYVVRVWDVTTGEERGIWGELAVNALVFNPDDMALYVLDTGLAYQFYRIDLVSGEIQYVFDTHGFTPDTYQPYQLTLSNSQAWFAISGGNHPIVVWELASEQVLHRLNIDSAVMASAFKPDDSLLAVGYMPSHTSSSLYLWDMATGEIAAELPTNAYIYEVLFDQTGEKLITLQTDPTAYRSHPRFEDPIYSHYRTVQLWDVMTQTPLASLEPPQLDMANIRFHPTDGNLLGIAEWSGLGVGGVGVWDIAQNERHGYSIGKGVFDVDFYPPANLLVGIHDDGEIVLWDTVSGDVVQQLQSNHQARIRFHPNGRWLVASEPEMEIWDLTTGEIVATEWFGQIVEFIDDGNTIFMGKGTAITGQFDIDTAQYDTEDSVQNYARGFPQFWQIARDGQFVVALEDSEYEPITSYLDFWDGEHIPTYQMDFPVQLTALALHPDDTLAVVGSVAGTLTFVDLPITTRLYTLQGNIGQFSVLAFNIDGSYLATLTNNGVLQIWGIDG